MAENAVPITTGTGSASIAGDLVSGNTYQQIKIVDGTIGGSSPLVVNANGSIGVSVLGAVPVAIISGGSTTPNQSVSGTVGASVIGNVPVNVTGGSVGLLSGSQNIGTVGINSGSVIGIIPGSIATVIIGGSIAASFTPPANQSVSGTVATISQGSIAAVIIGGSIAASFTAPPNQSVSGTVQTQVQGSVATVIIGGSIAASFTPPANQSVSGTVGASIIGLVPVTIISGSSSPANQSVSGTVGASVIGLTPVAVTNIPSISGTVNIGNTVTINSPSVYGNISGSIAGTYTEQTVATSITGLALVFKSNISTSVMTGVSVANPLPASVQGNVGMYFASNVTGQGGDSSPLTSYPVGPGATSPGPMSIGNFVFNGNNWDRVRGNSVIGMLVSTGASSVITVLTGNPSISGTVIVTGLQGASVSGTVGTSIIGQLPAGNAIIGAIAASISGLVNISGSVFAIVSALQGASVSGTAGASIIGTAPVTQSGAWTTSVVGGPITLYAPTSSFVSGVTSVITGTASVQVLAPAAGGQRNYITNVLVTNAAAVGTTVQLYDGGNVIYVGYAAASGGGFALSFPAPLRQSSIAGNLSALSSIQASVYVSASGYTAS